METPINTLYSDMCGGSWMRGSRAAEMLSMKALPEVLKMWGARDHPKHLQGRCRSKTDAEEKR